MTDQIVVEQALFGYRDGHNLITASVPLATRTRQFLATITDSSGSENDKAFTNSVTGLPVPDSDFYALFQTWPAPKMPRPGCVWSHVILIQIAHLAQLSSLSQLPNLFSCPSWPLDLASYQKSLRIDISETRNLFNSKSDHLRIRFLLRALYEHPDAGVVILDEVDRGWDRAIFQIWEQQWPRLRREFAFSTGSLGDRRLVGIPFDVQIAPISTERLWKRAGVATLLLNFVTLPHEVVGEDTPQWLQIAEADLLVGSNQGFRQFLFDYGSDVESPRASFASLAKAYAVISEHSSSSWEKLLHAVGDAFPMPHNAVRLKRVLLAVPESLQSADEILRMWSIVSFLLDSPCSSAYPTTRLDFSGAAISLWKEKPEQTLALLGRLVQRDEKPAAIAFAQGLASAVDAASLVEIADKYSELVPLVIRHHFELAFEIDTWKLNGHIQSRIYETLTKLSLSQPDWGRIVGAMFVAATYVSIKSAVAMAGKSAMDGAFRWLEHPSSEDFLPSHAWREALAMPAISLISQNENLHPAQLALSAWCIPVEELRNILSATRRDVLRMAEAAPVGIPAPLQISTSFLLLTLGLGNGTEHGLHLILKTFFPVHSALSSGAHSHESWWLLSPELPTLGWWKDWDHCERLRLAVRDALARHRACAQLRYYARSAEERKIVEKFLRHERKLY